jgi:citrate lyase subunit beta/citryl-CoA lyase
MRAFDLGPALLFCPADRPERYAKAAERADGVILDLEDAVAPAARVAAREALVATPLDPERTIVRINAASTNDFELDLAALRATSYRYVMLAKAEELPGALEDYALIPLIETARGVLAAPSLAAADNVVAMMWGAEDLIATLGGTASRFRDGHFRAVALHARSAVLIAAGAYGKAAIDTVHINIDDTAGLGAEARDAVASGFTATACIHPSQVAVVREAYAPTADEVAFARAVLERAESEGGVFTYEGRMIDEPVLRHARTVLSRVFAPPVP